MPTDSPSRVPAVAADNAREEIEVHGHIIDSLLLPKILDRILQMGGSFEILECRIGARRVDPSHARIAVKGDNAEHLAAILGDLVEHGAVAIAPTDVRTVAADIAGAFPEDFYSTTNQATQIRLGGRWVDVADQEMDCGIVVDHAAHGPMPAHDCGPPGHTDRRRP